MNEACLLYAMRDNVRESLFQWPSVGARAGAEADAVDAVKALYAEERRDEEELPVL